MNFIIPRDNEAELLIYIWKVIALPKISKKSLLYIISFDLFLLSPEKSEELIENGIINKYLIINDDSSISLAAELESKVIAWNEKRKNEIKKNLHKKGTIIEKTQNAIKSTFGPLLKAFSDQGVLNRAVSIPDDAVEILEDNFEKGIIKAQITGTKENPYKIEININNLNLSHDCHDFISKKSKDKKFCKHLTKLFLLLKEKNEDATKHLLEVVARDINEWEFSG